jgi:hypothetical protein
MLAAASLACAAPNGGAPTAAQSPRPDLDSLQLIAEAARRGEVDADTAVLYRVYAALDVEKLPPEYRGGRPLKDGTPILRDARARYDSLRPEIQAALRPYLFPKEAR